jgi:G3E family GTPase
VPFKVMVLENEVGAISIDHSLLQRRRGAPEAGQEEEDDGNDGNDGIYVLQNGCMCCLSRGTRSGTELERIVDYLLRVSKEKGFDYLVVETTGLADPGPIIETFLRLRASRFRLDSIVAMVDAHASQRYWNSTERCYKFPIELQRQLLYADIVALNKVDLATDAETQRLERVITDMNEEATLYRCEKADLDLTQIIDVNTFDAVKFRQAADSEHDGHDQGDELKDEHILTRGSHTDGVTTMHFDVDAPVDIAVFGEWYVCRIERSHTPQDTLTDLSLGV